MTTPAHLPRLAATALCLTLAASAAAHDTWILPESWRAKPDAVIGFAFTSGMGFPALDYAIEKERIARSGVRLAGKDMPLDVVERGAHALNLRARLPAAGVATAWIELSPKELTLEAGEVAHYLEEIGAAETAGAQWSRRPEPREWRETYRKHAKTFVSVGQATGDESWRRPIGLKLELVPETDPTSLRVGATLTARVLRDGAPLAGLAIGAAGPGTERRELVRTDAEGRVVIRFDRAGSWLLAGTDLRALPDGGWESDFTTLTVSVGPR